MLEPPHDRSLSWQDLGMMPALQILALDNNGIRNFPDSMGNLRQLQKLLISNNQLQAGLRVSCGQQ